MRPTSIVLLSGGLDSALAFAVAQRETDILFALTFDYGQRAATRENAAAAAICAKFDIGHKTVALPFFTELPGHPLFDTSAALPQPRTDQLGDTAFTRQSAKAVWVPNRNGIFLNVAAGLAEAGLADCLYVGFNAEEAATFPDNSEGFIKATNKALSFSTLRHIEVIAPPLTLNKSEILKNLLESDFPLSLVWSCYEGGERMCGLCESCQRLRRAAKTSSVGEELFFKTS